MMKLLVGHLGMLSYLEISTNFPFFNLEFWKSHDSIFKYDLSHTIEVEMTKFFVPYFGLFYLGYQTS